MIPRRLPTLVLAFGLAITLVACGDDDGGDESADSTSTTSTTTTSPVPEELDQAAFCAQLEDLGDIDPDDVPTQEAIDQLRFLALAGPDELSVYFAAYADLGQLIHDAGPEVLEDPDAFNELSDQIDTETAEEADAVLGAYAADECGLDIPLFN